MLAAMIVTLWMTAPLQAPPSETAAPAADMPAPQADSASPPASPQVASPEAAAPTAATEKAPPREKEVKKGAKKPKRPRPMWSTWGIVGGLGAAAAAAAVFAGGVGVQVLAFYFWYDQTNANRPYAQREFATQRARFTQYAALGLLLGGAASFFGGLIGATYAFGLGNPDPKNVKDL